MIRVVITYLSDGFIFDCSGHAGYDEKGRDIVCAGVSALCMALFDRLSELAAEDVVRVEYAHAVPGEAYMEISYDGDALCGVRAAEALETVRRGLERIEAQYPGYLLVE